MSDITVLALAEVLKVPVEKLISQLSEAGIDVKSAEDTISEEAKVSLLTHLRKTHGREQLSLSSPKKISLKRKSQSELTLSTGQGRSRTVNIEVRKKRTYIKRDELEEQAKQQQAALDAEIRKSEDQLKLKKEQQILSQEDVIQPSEDLLSSKPVPITNIDTNTKPKKEALDQLEMETPENLTQEEDKKNDEKARSKDEINDLKLAKDEKADKEEQKREEKSQEKIKRQKDKGKLRKSRRDHTLHVAEGSHIRRKKSRVRRSNLNINQESQHGFEKPTSPQVKEVLIPDTIIVADLAQKMAIKSNEVIRVAMSMGTMITINQTLDQDTAILIVEELGHIPKAQSDSGIEDELKQSLESNIDNAELKPRAPIVTVMGHVDHGKTSLLDYIREARVASSEAGGITQHIGAYNVKTDKGNITFLDTPGHAAFTAMRARGAQVTDIVVLVVAADDSVMPQTIEAIEHAKAASVPLIVAINKVDLDTADPEKIRSELSQHEVISEEWGGDTLFVSISAKTGEGIGDLLDSILLQSEILDLNAPHSGVASGVVVESALERGRGPVSTVLVSKGVLKLGDILLAGHEYGRIRAMFNESGGSLSEAGPSIPAVVLGLSGTPLAGDNILVVPNERKAREVAEYRQNKERDMKLASQQSSSIEDMFVTEADKGRKSLSILVKADVQGSSEALKDALGKISNDEVIVNVILDGVGGITESDVQLALASKAVIIGFNVRADSSARDLIRETKSDVRYYSVIYEAIDDVSMIASGLLSPEIREKIVGLAEVKDVFRSPKLGNIAGCLVIDGYMEHTKPIRVLRDNVVIYEGELESLRRFKDDVKEVRAGTECGIGVKNYNDVKSGDQIECYDRSEVPRSV
ncbi:MAG: translation initiation factor IF-2 [Pseudomonadota bacterium]|nr:translation initiation factor IF-2 [Gammaproteobacteria bacterium]MEE2684623.1 translation initiation factor IF-2 [Pseudomonadota bacterium]